jgi:hypothetical protein
MYDPNDALDLHVKPQHKGMRYCFIAAIVDRGMIRASVAETFLWVATRQWTITGCLTAPPSSIGSPN